MSDMQDLRDAINKLGKHEEFIGYDFRHIRNYATSIERLAGYGDIKRIRKEVRSPKLAKLVWVYKKSSTFRAEIPVSASRLAAKRRADRMELKQLEPVSARMWHGLAINTGVHTSPDLIGWRSVYPELFIAHPVSGARVICQMEVRK